MTMIDPGYSEAAATVLTWSADKFLGGVKKALGWGWSQAQWAKAQDAYDAAIIERYGAIRIFGQTTPKPLRAIFTDVYVLDTPTAHRRFAPRKLSEHLWNEDRSYAFRHGERKPGEELLRTGSRFFILGKPGAGKTTLLKRLAVREAQRGRWGRPLGKVPVFVALKEYVDAGRPLLDFIVEQFAVCHFPQARSFVERLLESGDALVLFDGLDEVTSAAEFGASRRGSAVVELERFAREYAQCHVIITCRIAAVDYSLEHSFTYLEMADFAPEQVEKFVRAWFWDETDKKGSAALANRMLDAWAQPEHRGIRDLARSPLLLTLLCLNYAETQSFPARRVEIYEEALDALLKKWDNSRQIQRGTLYKTLSLGRKKQMFARIAYDAFARGQILFEQSELEAALLAYLKHVPELPAEIDIDAEAVLQEIIAQHGIFAYQANRLYSFAHLTFQEYYTAKYVVDNSASGTLANLLGHVTDDKWRETILMTASLLSDATDFLNGFTAVLRSLAGNASLSRLLAAADGLAYEARAGYRHPAKRLVCLTIVVSISIAETIARDLDSDSTLDLARTLARALARALVLARDLDLTLAIDRALALTIDLDHALDLGPALALALDLALDLEGALAIARSHNFLRDRNRDFLRDRNLALDLALDLEDYLDLDLDRDLDRAYSHGFKTYLNTTRLFYDCIQLAYTPDRRVFEDRILKPPP